MHSNIAFHSGIALPKTPPTQNRTEKCNRRPRCNPSGPKLSRSKLTPATMSSAKSHVPYQEIAVRKVTQKWVRNVVCELSLCPFAESVLDSQSLRTVISHANTDKTVKQIIANEIEYLLQNTPQEISTTLVVMPSFATDDFLQFHETCLDLEEFIENDEFLSEEILLACFHPEHQWQDTNHIDDPINFDKRAPFPIINILRAPQVFQYAKEGKTQRILENNKRTLQQIGGPALRELYNSLQITDI